MNDGCVKTLKFCGTAAILAIFLAASAGNVKFRADFKNPKLPAWIVTDKSGWEVGNGILRSKDNSMGGTSTLAVGMNEWSDYTLNFKLRCYTPIKDDHHWGITLPGGKLTLYTRSNGFALRGKEVQSQGIGPAIVPPIPAGPDAPFDSYSLSIQNGAVTLIRNGKTVGKLRKIPYGTGKLEFYFYRDSAEFSEMEVEGETAPPPDPSTNWLGVTRQDIAKVESMLSDENRGTARPVSDRAYWDAFTVNRRVLDMAEKTLSTEPVPDYNKAWLDNARGINWMTIAEAKENCGRFIPQLAKYIHTVISCWEISDPRFIIDLHSTRTIRDLAEVYWILGEKLPPETVKEIKTALDQKCFGWLRKAYAAPSQFSFRGLDWLYVTTNWNPFCQLGVLTAADIMLPKHERAVFIANAVKSLETYYNAFSDDGYIVEGASYYSMGFLAYLNCLDIIDRMTHGKIPNPSGTKWENMLLYPIRYSMDKNLYPQFADCGNDGRPEGIYPWLLGNIDLVGNGADFPDAKWDDDYVGAFLGEALYMRTLAERARQHTGGVRHEVRPTTFFHEPQVVVCRDYSDRNPKFAFAAKGGNNGEDHNHNDLGSFCLSWDDHIILGDPGCPEYSLEYFTGKRYLRELASSFGHPVPCINGFLQGAGGAFQAKLLEFHETEDGVSFSLDLIGAYPPSAKLKKLERTFVFSRNKRELTITDSFELLSPGSFTDALIAYQNFQNVGDSEWRTRELTIKVESQDQLSFSCKKIEAKNNHGELFPYRLSYTATEVSSGKIVTTIILNDQK